MLPLQRQQIACGLVATVLSQKMRASQKQTFAMYKTVNTQILLSFVQLFHMVFRPFILVSTPASTQCWLSHRGGLFGQP